MLSIYTLVILIILYFFWFNFVVLTQYAVSIFTHLKLKLWKGASLFKLCISMLEEIRLINWLAATALKRFKPLKHPSDSSFVCVFIHGYFGCHGDWRWFLSKFLNKTSISSITLSHSSTKSVPDLAAEIERKIRNLKLDKKKLILIGHSLGGLISAHLLEYTSLPIHRVYCIGSPFFGTPVAKLGYGASCRDMLPMSPYLLKINKKIDLNRQNRYFFLWSVHDNTVLPAPMDIPYSHQTIYYTHYTGHYKLIFSTQTLNLVISDLKQQIYDKTRAFW